MPAPVPPGYTRGPIVFMGASADPTVEEGLRQWLWREAGGYGARLVLLTVEAAQIEPLQALRTQLASLECDQIGEIVALDRATARKPEHVAPIEQATGIVLLGDDPRLLSAILGGSALAQAIRRANARSKLVAGLGAAGAFLCQHTISPGMHAATMGETVLFGPGLGLVNRLVVDAGTIAPLHTETRLLAAVNSNPFLIGVGLAPGSATILHSDNTLQASGPNQVTIVDGQSIEAAHVDAASRDAVVGALYYTLQTGDGYNLDDHSFRPAGEIDLPPTGPVTSVF